MTRIVDTVEHGWITTLRRDGSPRTSRVWFVEMPEAVWIATSVASWKVADVERDPRVSFAIEGRHGVITAKATSAAIDSQPEVLAAFRLRYGGWDAVDPTVDGPRILLRISR